MPVNQPPFGPLGPHQTSAGRGSFQIPLIRGSSKRMFIKRYLSLLNWDWLPCLAKPVQDVVRDKIHLIHLVFTHENTLCLRPGVCLGQGHVWPILDISTGCLFIEPEKSHFQTQGRWLVLRPQAHKGHGKSDFST